MLRRYCPPTSNPGDVAISVVPPQRPHRRDFASLSKRQLTVADIGHMAHYAHFKYSFVKVRAFMIRVRPCFSSTRRSSSPVMSTSALPFRAISSR